MNFTSAITNLQRKSDRELRSEFKKDISQIFDEIRVIKTKSRSISKNRKKDRSQFFHGIKLVKKDLEKSMQIIRDKSFSEMIALRKDLSEIFELYHQRNFSVQLQSDEGNYTGLEFTELKKNITQLYSIIKDIRTDIKFSNFPEELSKSQNTSADIYSVINKSGMELDISKMHDDLQMLRHNFTLTTERLETASEKAMEVIMEMKNSSNEVDCTRISFAEGELILKNATGTNETFCTCKLENMSEKAKQKSPTQMEMIATNGLKECSLDISELKTRLNKTSMEMKKMKLNFTAKISSLERSPNSGFDLSELRKNVSNINEVIRMVQKNMTTINKAASTTQIMTRNKNQSQLSDEMKPIFDYSKLSMIKQRENSTLNESEPMIEKLELITQITKLQKDISQITREMVNMKSNFNTKISAIVSTKENRTANKNAELSTNSSTQIMKLKKDVSQISEDIDILKSHFHDGEIIARKNHTPSILAELTKKISAMNESFEAQLKGISAQSADYSKLEKRISECNNSVLNVVKEKFSNAEQKQKSTEKIIANLRIRLVIVTFLNTPFRGNRRQFVVGQTFTSLVLKSF